MIHSRNPLLAATLIALSATAISQADLRTPSESSGFTEYTSYDDMMTYLQEVQATTTEMKLSTYGETWEGRELPFDLLGKRLGWMLFLACLKPESGLYLESRKWPHLYSRRSLCLVLGGILIS